MFPLFWFTVPSSPPHREHSEWPHPFAMATFGPLYTTGAEYALWVVELLPEFDWSADCDAPEWFEQHELPPSATVWL